MTTLSPNGGMFMSARPGLVVRPMGRKNALGRLMGALAGSPYQRITKQLDKVLGEVENEAELAKRVEQYVRLIEKNYAEARIDADEHDLLMEQLEDMDPLARSFPRLEADDESTDWIDDAAGPNVMTGMGGSDLDEVMRSKKDTFGSSFARDEYEEYKARMTEEFLRESDDVLRRGGPQHVRARDPTGRVFVDDWEEANMVKQKIAQEAGINLDPEPDPRQMTQPLPHGHRPPPGDGRPPQGQARQPPPRPRDVNPPAGPRRPQAGAPMIAERQAHIPPPRPAAPQRQSAAVDETDDLGHRVDEDGYEWYEDGEGVWWYRAHGSSDEWEAWDD